MSSSEWDDSNSFGSSFSSIFGNIDNMEIANIYCRSGLPNTQTVHNFFQITEKSLIKNFIDSKVPSGITINVKSSLIRNSPDVFTAKQLSIVNFVRNNRWILFFWIKDLIWLFGKWRSKELKAFIDEFNPDIIFLPIYYSVYMNKIGLFLKEYSNKPMFGYISDDNYTLNQFSLSPFFWIDRFIKRKWVKKAIQNCITLYVISDVQKKDYDKAFNINSKILFKGHNFTEMRKQKYTLNSSLSLIYTGNIGDGRFKTLASIGAVLDKINSKSKSKGYLNIYSHTPLSNKMKSTILKVDSINFKGSITHDKVAEIQTSADILVHVEPMDLKGKLQSRHSFSTKLVDYFAVSRCIFAVGWKQAASIKYLLENDAAIVATSSDEIEKQLELIFENPRRMIEYGQKAWNLGTNKHQIKKIQKNMMSDFNRIVNEGN